MVRGTVIYLLIEPLLDTVAVPEAQSGAGDRAGDFLHLSALWFLLRLPNKKITRRSVRSAHSHLPSGAKCGCSGSLGNVLPFSDVTSPQTVFQLLHHLLPAAPRSPRTGLHHPPPRKAGRCPRWCLPPAPRHRPGRRRRRHRPPAPRPDPNGPRRRPGSSRRRWQRSMWRKSWTSSSPPAPRRRRVSVCRGCPLTAALFLSLQTG